MRAVTLMISLLFTPALVADPFGSFGFGGSVFRGPILDEFFAQSGSQILDGFVAQFNTSAVTNNALGLLSGLCSACTPLVPAAFATAGPASTGIRAATADPGVNVTTIGGWLDSFQLSGSSLSGLQHVEFNWDNTGSLTFDPTGFGSSTIDSIFHTFDLSLQVGTGLGDSFDGLSQTEMVDEIINLTPSPSQDSFFADTDPGESRIIGFGISSDVPLDQTFQLMFVSEASATGEADVDFSHTTTLRNIIIPKGSTLTAASGFDYTPYIVYAEDAPGPGAQTPEPATLGVSAMALVAVVLARRRRAG